jgi:hypothetical protein
MSLFRELLSQKSDTSMMRFLSLISLLIAGGIACFGVYAGRDPMSLAGLCAVFVGGSFGGKVSQRFAESKVNIEEK